MVATNTNLDPTKLKPLAPATQTQTKTQTKAPGPAPTQGGIVNVAAGPQAGQSNTFDKPTQTQVDAPTETVEDRLKSLTAKDSKYVELAQQDAMRSANTRGLINSSMAAGAGTEAAIRTALPIAQQDAKTYTDTRLNNQAAANQFEENRQLTELGKETATLEKDLGIERDTTQSDLRKSEDVNRADLNNATDILRSTLAKEEEAWAREQQTNMELILADEKISNDLKMSYVQTINDITLQAAQDINAISLGEGTAEQQAAAIKRIEEVRDANISVYENLLKTSAEWDWGTDFTSNPVAISAFSDGTGAPGVTDGSDGTPKEPYLGEYNDAIINDDRSVEREGITYQPDDYGYGSFDTGSAGWYLATSPDGSSTQTIHFDSAGNPSTAGWTILREPGYEPPRAPGPYENDVNAAFEPVINPNSEFTTLSAEAAQQYRSDLSTWHTGGMVGPQPNPENYWDIK